MYEDMKTHTVDYWKAEGKWEEYILMIERMHHGSSQIKEEREKW